MPRKKGVYKHIAFMLTPEQYEVVKTESERLGLDLADYARQCLRDCTPGFKDATDVPRRGSYYSSKTVTERLQEIAGDVGKVELGWHNDSYGFWLVRSSNYTFLAKEAIKARPALQKLVESVDPQNLGGSTD